MYSHSTKEEFPSNASHHEEFNEKDFASPTLEFYGGKLSALLPIIIFLGFCITFFVVLKAFDMSALSMAALISLMLTALLAKGKNRTQTYWNAVYNGVKESIPILVLLLAIGIFSQLIKLSNLSGGFVWLADLVHVGPGLFTALTFGFVCIIATATGSSLGTMFTAFPIFYPAGVLLGADPAFLAAAIVGGGIFGDNLAPISDTTIISTSTQYYRDRQTTADVGGAVRSRFKYSAIAGIATFLIFAFFAGNSQTVQTNILSKTSANPQSLFMLIPVAIMLIVAVLTKDMYMAIVLGVLCGSVLGLSTGILHTTDILNVKDGTPGGFLIEGVNSMTSTVILVLCVYGIMGVLNAAGILSTLVDFLSRSRLGKSVIGTEIIMMLGITFTTLIFGGVTSAAMATFGKIHNELGMRMNLHPYRRANLLDGFANSIALCIPFLSVFVFIGSQLTSGYDNIASVSVTNLGMHMIYPFLLFIVLLVSVVTGWGRRFEGANGEPIKVVAQS
ncbi:Na+/H+ antiporter NhaC family protein [Alloscardovia theropitheci]|uniref:Na+/H+ antiporter NhaC family protein n=1 Tax=Alloscardovia theropitheci TaxID=2496842 RepID=A0A4R0QRP9_9BIFI|nr:Na+/H+ antiporter NhaC family protein [Alloscardovia theropitheci]TCD55044.1 Na+/H+ antiporter NhaC family protein [Alloscardovia theropitheci]